MIYADNRRSRSTVATLLLLGLLLLVATAGSTYVLYGQRIMAAFRPVSNSISLTEVTDHTAQSPTFPPVSVAPIIPTPVPKPQHDYIFPPVANGMVPVVSRIPTKERVVFLTIDDGIVTNPNDAQIMQAAHVKATFFLVYRFIKGNPSFFSSLALATGSDIENHSYDHYLLTNLNYTEQKQDICQNADIFTQWFGKRPILFRPSGGAYNTDTLRAAAACNVHALIMWDASVNNGSLQYQVGHGLRPGDIVLMHFRTTFQEDLNAFASAAKTANLQPELLLDWDSSAP